MLKLIAAVSKNGGIGLNNRLLFSIRADMQRFKALTTGHTVIMGRETLDSLPRGAALPNRENWVLTRNPHFSRENVTVFHSVEELLAALDPSRDYWVMGGAEVYRLLLPYCDRLELTEVDETADADRFFPVLGQEWTLVSHSEVLEETGIKFRFCSYIRNQY